MVSFTGDQIKQYQIRVLRSALTLYANTGIKANRMYTPTNMMIMAKRLTGKNFPARDYPAAIRALSELLGDK